MAYYRDSEGKFGPDSEQYVEIFSEYDFDCSIDGCDFFCPECRDITKCRTYEEIKDEWETFYMQHTASPPGRFRAPDVCNRQTGTLKPNSG